MCNTPKPFDPPVFFLADDTATLQAAAHRFSLALCIYYLPDRAVVLRRHSLCCCNSFLVAVYCSACSASRQTDHNTAAPPERAYLVFVWSSVCFPPVLRILAQGHKLMGQCRRGLAEPLYLSSDSVCDETESHGVGWRRSVARGEEAVVVAECLLKASLRAVRAVLF